MPDIVIRIPFPGRLNLNSRWVPKGKQLIRMGNYDPEPDKAMIRDLLAGTPETIDSIQKAIDTDWYYFREMKRHIADQIAKLA